MLQFNLGRCAAQSLKTLPVNSATAQSGRPQWRVQPIAQGHLNAGSGWLRRRWPRWLQGLH